MNPCACPGGDDNDSSFDHFTMLEQAYHDMEHLDPNNVWDDSSELAEFERLEAFCYSPDQHHLPAAAEHDVEWDDPAHMGSMYHSPPPLSPHEPSTTGWQCRSMLSAASPPSNLASAGSSPQYSLPAAHGAEHVWDDVAEVSYHSPPPLSPQPGPTADFPIYNRIAPSPPPPHRHHHHHRHHQRRQRLQRHLDMPEHISPRGPPPAHQDVSPQWPPPHHQDYEDDPELEMFERMEAICNCPTPAHSPEPPRVPSRSRIPRPASGRGPRPAAAPPARAVQAAASTSNVRPSRSRSRARPQCRCGPSAPQAAARQPRHQQQRQPPPQPQPRPVAPPRPPSATRIRALSQPRGGPVPSRRTPSATGMRTPATGRQPTIRGAFPPPVPRRAPAPPQPAAPPVIRAPQRQGPPLYMPQQFPLTAQEQWPALPRGGDFHRSIRQHPHDERFFHPDRPACRCNRLVTGKTSINQMRLQRHWAPPLAAQHIAETRVPTRVGPRPQVPNVPAMPPRPSSASRPRRMEEYYPARPISRTSIPSPMLGGHQPGRPVRPASATPSAGHLLQMERQGHVQRLGVQVAQHPEQYGHVPPLNLDIRPAAAPPGYEHDLSYEHMFGQAAGVRQNVAQAHRQMEAWSMHLDPRAQAGPSGTGARQRLNYPCDTCADAVESGAVSHLSGSSSPSSGYPNVSPFSHLYDSSSSGSDPSRPCPRR